MNVETFNKLLDELDGNSLETLKQKNAMYASADDCLHNFDSGAEIMGSTPAQCAWGYMTKHLVALRDKVQRDDFSDRDDLLEKCQDIINYIRFIWLIGNERVMDNVTDEVVFDLSSGSMELFPSTICEVGSELDDFKQKVEVTLFRNNCLGRRD